MKIKGWSPLGGYLEVGLRIVLLMWSGLEASRPSYMLKGPRMMGEKKDLPPKW